MWPSLWCFVGHGVEPWGTIGRQLQHCAIEAASTVSKLPSLDSENGTCLTPCPLLNHLVVLYTLSNANPTRHGSRIGFLRIEEPKCSELASRGAWLSHDPETELSLCYNHLFRLTYRTAMMYITAEITSLSLRQSPTPVQFTHFLFMLSVGQFIFMYPVDRPSSRIPLTSLSSWHENSIFCCDEGGTLGSTP